MTFSVWKTLFLDSFQLWRKIILPYILLAFTSFFSFAALALFIFVPAFFFKNIEPNIAVKLAFILGGLFIFALIITIMLIFLISSYCIVRNGLEGKKTSVLHLFFVESRIYLRKVFIVKLRKTWFIMWPFVISLICIIATSLLTFVVLPEINIINSLREARLFHMIISGWIGICIFTFFIYRAIKAFFDTPYLLQLKNREAKTGKEIFTESLELTKGRWWKVFLSIVSFNIIISILPFSFSLASDFLENLEYLPIVLQAFAVVFNLFIAPISITFIYLLTDWLRQNPVQK